MKEYIKKFASPSVGDNYLIASIPFMTSVETTGQNLVCNQTGKKLVNVSETLVIQSAVPEGFVDFGLPSGTLWSNKNLGATNADTAESWYGDYYAWGETEPKTQYDWSTYKYAKGAYNKLTKYCNNAEYGNAGFTDNLTQLVPEDDIAATMTNSAWRIPTKEDFEELITETTNRWVTDYNGISGLNGRLFTKVTITRPAFKTSPLYWITSNGVTEITDELWSYMSVYTLDEINAQIGGDIREQIYKDAGMTINAKYDADYGFVEGQSVSMFIPSAGYYDGSNIDGVGSSCFLWSSSLGLGLDPNSSAYYLNFDSSRIGMDNYGRCIGFSVRAVQHASNS